MNTPPSESTSPAAASYPARCAVCAVEVPPPPGCLCASCGWSFNDSQLPSTEAVRRWERGFWALPVASLLMILVGLTGDGAHARIPAALAWLPLTLWIGLGPRTGWTRVIAIGLGGLGTAQAMLPLWPTAGSPPFPFGWALVLVMAFLPARLVQPKADAAPRLLVLGKVMRLWAVMLAVAAALMVGALIWPPADTAAGATIDRGGPLRVFDPRPAVEIADGSGAAIGTGRCVAIGILALLFWKFGSIQLGRGRLAARLPPAALRDTQPAHSTTS